MITDEALDFYDMLTQECLVLDRVESHLREKGDIALVQELIEFQTDAALETAWAIYGHKDTPDGREINERWKNHIQITPDRYSIFHRVAEGLKGHELEAAFLVIVEQIPKFTNAPSSGIDMTREL